MMPRISRRGFLSAALTAGLLSSCAPEASTPTPAASSQAPALTIGLTYVPDIQFAPLYVAEKNGYFSENGLNVVLRHHGAQEALLGALQAKDEDVVFAGGGEMMQGRSQDVPVRNFATMYQNYPVAIIVPADSPITDLAGLRGKKIGLPGEFGENWFYLLACLADAGLTKNDVSIESIGYTQFVALTSGNVDAIVGYLNNDLERFNEAGFATNTLVLSDPPLVSVGFGALDETIEARKTELVSFLAAVEQAATFCSDNPDQTVEIAAEYIDTLVDADQKARALATLKATMPFYLGDFGYQDPERWERMATFLSQNELLAAPVAAGDCFTKLD